MTETPTALALPSRYGGAAPEGALPSNATIELLYRHRSVRRYTPDPVDDATVTAIIAAAQSAATSSNLQSWSVVELREPVRKAAASVLAGDQAFIRDAPVFLVFVADWGRNALIARRRGAPADGIGFVETTLVGFVDAALAAQNAVVAAESLGLGAVFVGSVRNNPEQLSELLGLPDGAFPVVGVALGHPDPADAAGVKPRLSQDVVRHREIYHEPDAARIEDYEERLTAYYRSQGAARGWVDAVLRRVEGAASLHGRHTLRAALERRGLPSR
ncbi:NADPH-dependent oxidoreductase [Microbacterium tumbae]